MVTRLRALVDAIRDGDDAMVQEAVLRLSRSRRRPAPDVAVRAAPGRGLE